MIQITLSENGNIAIDATSADAQTMDVIPYTPYARDRVIRIAEALVSHPVRLISFHKKRGVSNNGWNAWLVDDVRKAAYLKANGYEEQP